MPGQLPTTKISAELLLGVTRNRNFLSVFIIACYLFRQGRSYHRTPLGCHKTAAYITLVTIVMHHSFSCCIFNKWSK